MSKTNIRHFARLVDWIEGRLSEQQTMTLAEQVAAADDAMRADITWLRVFMKMSTTTVLVAPPTEVHQRLVHLFEAHAQR